MKLPDFNQFEPFILIRKKMGITGTLITPTPKSRAKDLPKANPLLEKLKRGEDIEIIFDDIEIAKDSTFVYEGEKVFLYIRDQWYTPQDPDREYKYHICHCRTLERMRKNNKFALRYVASKNTDGKFLINLQNIVTREKMAKDKLVTLNVCIICLKSLIKSYPNEKDLFIYESFNLGRFLSEHSTEHTYKPKHTAFDAPDNEYPDNWKEITRSYRESVGWKCEGKYHIGDRDFSHDHNFLDTHHLNSQKNDCREENLQALCRICHNSQSGHENMYIPSRRSSNK